MFDLTLLLFLQCFLVLASPGFHERPFGVTPDPSSANGQTFDYVIVGAGLAGTTVAGRLSEDQSKTVLLVEAGNDERTNPLISNILNFSRTIGTDMEWRWDTELSRFIRGGRTLGGSSSINGAQWTRAMRVEYDALSQFLSEDDADMNWNFDSLFFYMKKAEAFHPPDDALRAKGADFIPEYHGFTGPVHAAFHRGMFGGPHQPAFVQAVQNVTGIKLCQDIVGSDSNCAAYVAQSVNPLANDNRSSSAESYLTPVEHKRTNWLTLVGYRVTKILLDGEAPKVTATGVQFKSSNETGETFTAYARKEVIISSGAIGTPQVLQVSGIGDPSILEPLGIQVRVNITMVGRNFQIRASNGVTHSLNRSVDPDGASLGNCLAFPTIKELFALNVGSNGSIGSDEIGEYVMAMYPTWAQSQVVNALNADALTTIFGIQANLLVNGEVPVAEMSLATMYPFSMRIRAWAPIPFSRGNVTITSPSIFAPPRVIANWFDVDFDLMVETALARTCRRILNQPSFDGILTGEISPGTGVVPDDEHGGSDDAWKAWIWDAFEVVQHPVGTAAMMRRDLGGVVDGKLRVYDTANLRIVDASIFPLEMTTHPQSSLYGIAEKAADIIKAGL